MNGLYLVCDGGEQRRISCCLEKNRTCGGRAQGAGANANFVPPAEAAHTVYAGVMECLAQAGGAPAQVREFVLFIPGFRPALPELETLFGGAGTSGSWAMKRTLFMGAGRALRHRRAQRYRLFATGRDKAGRTATAGGWGPLFSDEGSGYHIAFCACRVWRCCTTRIDRHASGKKTCWKCWACRMFCPFATRHTGPILRAGMWRG